MMEIKESGLTFTFADQISASKFDDAKFYRNAYNKLPNGKGVDIIADSPDMLQLIEVKTVQGMKVKIFGGQAPITANCLQPLRI